MTDPTLEPAMQMLSRAMRKEKVITTEDAVVLSGSYENVESQIGSFLNQHYAACVERTERHHDHGDLVEIWEAARLTIDCFLADITDAEAIPGPGHSGLYYLGAARTLEVIARIRPYGAIQQIRGREYIKFSVEQVDE